MVDDLQGTSTSEAYRRREQRGQKEVGGGLSTVMPQGLVLASEQEIDSGTHMFLGGHFAYGGSSLTRTDR